MSRAAAGTKVLSAEHKHYYYIFLLPSYAAGSACTVIKPAWDQPPVACGMDSIMAFEQLAEVPFKAALADFSRLSVAESLSTWPESLIPTYACSFATHTLCQAKGTPEFSDDSRRESTSQPRLQPRPLQVSPKKNTSLVPLLHPVLRPW